MKTFTIENETNNIIAHATKRESSGDAAPGLRIREHELQCAGSDCGPGACSL